MKTTQTDEVEKSQAPFWLPTRRDFLVALLAIILFNGGWWLLARMRQGIKENDVDAVAAQLVARNPGFDGKVTWVKDDEGAVVKFGLCTDSVTDLSPLRALPRLEELSCTGSGNATGKLVDLRPLKGLSLSVLHLNNNSRLKDLSPLKRMALQQLNLWGWAGTDLSPLQTMPLKKLNCGGGQVADLSPLAGLPLEELVVNYSKVTNLSPLKNVPLRHLSLRGCAVADLSPLRGMPLAELNVLETEVTDLTPIRDLRLIKLTCDFEPARDTAIVQSIKTLKVLNDKPLDP